MQQPQQPEKTLRWVKASKWPAKLTGERIGKTNHKRHVLVTILKNGTADWRNREYEDEKVEFILLESAEDLSAPASPVEEKARIEDRVEYEKWIKGIINEEMGHGGSASSLAALLTFEFQAHIDAVYEGAAEWESKYKEAQIKLDKLTESTPPVIEIGEKGEIPKEVIEKISRLALHEASLHFNPKYSPDQNTACVICYTNGAKEFYRASHPTPAPIVGEREEADREKEKLGWEIVALSERLSEAREQLASARTLILNIKRGNIYQEPADECDKWLNSNPETK